MIRLLFVLDSRQLNTILRAFNRKAQNRTCKQPFTLNLTAKMSRITEVFPSLHRILRQQTH